MSVDDTVLPAYLRRFCQVSFQKHFKVRSTGGAGLLETEDMKFESLLIVQGAATVPNVYNQPIAKKILGALGKVNKNKVQ